MAPPATGQLAAPLDLDALEMLTSGTSYADAVRQLLGVVRTQLDMQAAWVSEFVGGDQVLRFVDAEPGLPHPPREGSRGPLSGSFCARVLDGRFPALIPDTRAVPEAALLEVTAELHIGSYVGVPLTGPGDVAVGMLCAINTAAAPGLSERDVAALRLMARLLHDLQERAMTAAQAVEQRDRRLRAMAAVIGGTDRHPVLQPIVDLVSGRAVAAEGLTRFSTAGDPEPARSPAQWFDDAGRLGLREQLELATAASILDLLDTEVPESAAVSINLSPGTLTGEGFPSLLVGRPLHRIIIEMTEHSPVEDYDELAAVLQPRRQQGLQVAVDDAGAGYASLQHVLAVSPDLIQIDMALIRGSDGDLARRTLLTALADFAEATGCRLVAEGVETDGELRAVANCGAHLAQGYLLARPSPSPSWSGYKVP